MPASGTERGGSSLALRVVAHERYAAAVAGFAFSYTSWDTLQADALKLVTKEFPSSLAVEGELRENGLAAYGLYGDDLLAPPHELVGEHKNRETVKAPALRLGGGRVHGRVRLPSAGARGVGA